MSISSLITRADRIDFAANFIIPDENNLLDRLFPDVKTDNMKLTYKQIVTNQAPLMALVHAFNSEAKIGQRPALKQVELEKMLIKEKMMLDEEYAIMYDNLRDNSVIADYIFNDMATTADRVLMRTKVMKGEILNSAGKFTVDENNVKMTIDFDVPARLKKTFTWSTGTPKILADIQTMIDALAEKGRVATKIITSSKNIAKMASDPSLTASIFGNAEVGRQITKAQLNTWLTEHYSLTIEAFDRMYSYDNAKDITTKRLIEENKLIVTSKDVIGRGIWGITPEERAEKITVQQSKNIYIMNTIWEVPDPVSTWTKASGVFVPVLADNEGQFFATIA